MKNLSSLEGRMDYISESMSDDIHQKTLDKTGFWGEKGAGCMFFCSNTKKFMLLRRSQYVQEPNTWGMAGGAIDPKENVEKALIREIKEETGYNMNPSNLIPLSIYKKGKFRYYNFIAVVAKEFIPKLNFENSGYMWFNIKKPPSPLHFGVKSVLKNPSDKKIIKSLVG